ncbi:MAG: hypothetical protein OEL20_01590 [Sulfuritalea sp.]|nr:hypothetical protein [Sulfuritalea sp.]
MQPLALRLSAALALAAIWLLTHRYFGIQHDGMFYAVQALARTDPQAFRHDLFFEFGSQDDYSLFSLVYAWLTGLLGLGHAALVLLVAAHLAWALAAYAIARQWLSGPPLWIGLALVFALPGHYGAQGNFAHDILRYAESFLTARSWAEALVLASVAASLGGHRRTAFAAVAGGFLCHPIIALPGVLFLAFFHAQLGARPLGVLALVAAAAAFAPPGMDADWLAIVRYRAPFVLLDGWQWNELAEPFAWIGILLAAGTSTTAPIHRACRSLALTGTAGFYLALLGTATHATLLIQAQPWRCLWLIKVAGLLALTEMLAGRWRRSNADRWLLAGLTAAAMTANTLGGPVALLLAGIAHVAWRNGAPPELPRWLPVAGGTALALVLLESALALVQQLAYLAERLQEWANPASRMPSGDPAAFLQGPLALLLPAGIALLLRVHCRCPRGAVLAASLGLAVSAAGWYRADDTLQAALYSASPPRPFGELIARDETVYWQNNFLYTWFLLRQGNYASKQQSVGVVFSRATAMESARRLERLMAFGSTDAAWTTGNKAGHQATRAGLTQLCSDPVLDSVIVNHRIDEMEAPRWVDSPSSTRWFLYRCVDFRAAPSAAAPRPS